MKQNRQAQDEAEARAINAGPWEPLPGMTKRRCEDCDFWFATPRNAPADRCPDCALRLRRSSKKRRDEPDE
jgi:hypothetical protein